MSFIPAEPLPPIPVRRNVDPDAFERRTVALELAVASHGPAAGEPSDHCFTARADHFLAWLDGEA